MIKIVFLVCFTFFLFLLSPVTHLHGQTLEYDILVFIPIGKFKVERSFGTNNSVTIRTNSYVNVLFKTLQIISNTTLKDGEIISSEYSHYINNKLRVSTRLVNNDKGQKIVTYNGGHSRQMLQRPLFSVADLYFKEPLEIDSVYSERFGKVCPISEIGSRIYKLCLPDKSTIEYKYKGGQCIMVKSYLKGKSVKLVIKDSS